MEGYLRDVSQIFTRVVADDPHLYVLEKIDFLLSRKLRAFTQADPPLDHIRSASIALLHKFWRHIHARNAHQSTIVYLLYYRRAS